MLLDNIPLTSMGKELWVNRLERLLTYHPRRTFRLESPVQTLDLLLGEPCYSAQGRNGLGPVPGRRLKLLQFRVCQRRSTYIRLRFYFKTDIKSTTQFIPGTIIIIILFFIVTTQTKTKSHRLEEITFVTFLHEELKLTKEHCQQMWSKINQWITWASTLVHTVFDYNLIRINLLFYCTECYDLQLRTHRHHNRLILRFARFWGQSLCLSQEDEEVSAIDSKLYTTPQSEAECLLWEIRYRRRRRREYRMPCLRVNNLDRRRRRSKYELLLPNTRPCDVLDGDEDDDLSRHLIIICSNFRG